MITAALIATTLMALVALGFTAGAVLFLNKIRAEARSASKDASLPKAAILLALRGPDAYLDDCIRSLLNQDYPDYDLHIVVDSEQDPAWEIVNRVLEEEGAINVRASLLRDPLFTCGLKCSALLQMLSEIDPEVEVLALIDGDVVPHRTWLRQLATPLADEGVGATFGIPWYFPRDSGWASVARKVCWIPAAILMALCGWIWGGTAALPARVFRDPALADRWSQSVSSDASIRDVIKDRHLRLEWVPALVMPNLEPGRFGALVSHLGRSLATSRLYLNRWPLTFLVVCFATGALGVTLLVCAASALVSNATATLVSTAGLASYMLVLMTLLLLVERRAFNVARNNGLNVPALNLATFARIVPVIPFAHGIYLVAAVKAQFTRSLTWRGVRYAINDKHNVQRVESLSEINPLAGAAYVVVNDETSGPQIDPFPGTSIAPRFTDVLELRVGQGDRQQLAAKPQGSRKSELAREQAIEAKTEVNT